MAKDLSRLDRNVIDAGFYTEQFFPRLGIRFISIIDNYDSSTYSGDISLPLMNLMNEAYALDISRKTKSQAWQAMKDGVYVGGLPPYGYIRSPDNHRKLIMDDPAAMIVKQIFIWMADGINSSEIARKLNTSKVPPPRSHRGVKGAKNFGTWHISTVERILDNEIYLGHLVQGKTETVNFLRKPTSSDEWIHVYDSHEAIVSSELFHAAQAMRQSIRDDIKANSIAPYSPNIYKGRIYCACCGGRMERKKDYKKYIFRCVSNRTIPGSCEGNRIDEDAVNRALSEQLLRLREDLSTQAENPYKENEFLPEMRFIDTELHY